MPTEVDVVVVGGGAGGLTAAIVAAKAGLEVLLAEKTAYFGGTTAYSGGAVWIPDNHLMKQAGFSDSRKEARDYLRAVLGNFYDSAKIETYLDTAPEMLKFMETHSEVKFKSVPMPDYESTTLGWKRSRTLLTQPYDGRKLREHRTMLRPQYNQLTLFNGMQLEGADIHQLRQAFKNPASFTFTSKLVAKYFLDRLRYGKTSRLVNGNALAARLVRSAVDSGITLWNNAPVNDLIKENGFVRGVVLRKDGKEITVRARKGVILASGGYGANKEMRAKHVPLAEHHWSMQPDGNVGDGIRLGVSAGGRLHEDNQANGIWAPVSVMRKADGSIIKFPHLFLDRQMPGSIAVDHLGRRFVNEAHTYQKFVEKMQQMNMPFCHLIADYHFLRTYGLGMVRPAPFPYRSFVENGYLIKASSIAELAEKIGVDPTTLEQTIATFNVHAEKGVDPDFHRGGDPFTQFRGDPDNKPNPSLGLIREAPFFAVVLYPGDLSTVNGLETNANAQVTTADGIPIDGLYAVGLDMNSMTRGLYPGGGSSLGPAMTFGYIAARHIASKVTEENLSNAAL